MRSKRHYTKRLYSKFFLFYLFWALLAVFLFSTYGRMEINDNTYFFHGMNFVEGFIYFVFKYFLNFPLTIFNWFSNEYLYYTFGFFALNSVVMAWIVARVFRNKVKAISNALTYILIGTVILMVTYVIVSFIV